jgi:hypothetical protein
VKQAPQDPVLTARGRLLVNPGEVAAGVGVVKCLPDLPGQPGLGQPLLNAFPVHAHGAISCCQSRL